MATQRFLIWGYDDVTEDIPAPPTIPIEIGTQIRGITIYNISPYWLKLSNLYQQILLNIPPWYIYPFTNTEEGRLFVGVDTDFALQISFDGSLVQNQQVYAILSSFYPNSVPQPLTASSTPVHNISWQMVAQFKWNQLYPYYPTWTQLSNQ